MKRRTPEQQFPDLAAAFAARRCTCGAPAMSVWPGSTPLVIARLLIARGRDEVNWCSACLVQHGMLREAA
jgi:hypothetical protein